ncbi:MAG: aminopeptidase P family protein [Turicibacter sp.]|nr:aminopeptidase P family protein [Turicibacter sp.]
MEKLAKLREKMADNKIDALVIINSDAHQSEYLSDHWKVGEWFSGFTGSNSLIVATEKEAGLWTDGRYFIQAEQELKGSGITLFRLNEPGVPTYRKWLNENLAKTAKIAFDGRTMSASNFEALNKELKGKTITYDFGDLADELWKERPKLVKNDIILHKRRYAGKSVADKLKIVRSEMKKTEADMYLVAALDDIAWLTNMRGDDIPQTPVFFAFLLISEKSAKLFVEKSKITDKLAKHLKDFEICEYERAFDVVKKECEGKTVLYSPNSTNVQLFNALPKTVKTSLIIPKLKAVKNSNEIRSMKNAFIREGVALVGLLKWVSENKDAKIKEADVQLEISARRKRQRNCLGDSFTTIAGYGANAASPHYSPKNGGAIIKNKGLLLIDTGGQYLDGTTDITRTVAMGALTDEMKRDYTLVLKSHIALATAKFPKGTLGIQLDVFARQHVWAANQDYKHGTGHGLGFCLGVHEGPASISLRVNKQEILPGMVFTNEPAMYRRGKHGIRTENVLLVVPLKKTEFGDFLGFETISFCPIDTRPIEPTLLTAQEKDWLKKYNKRVYETLSPFLTSDEKKWLKNECKSIFNTKD